MNNGYASLRIISTTIYKEKVFDWSLVVGFKWAALEGSKHNPKPVCSYKSSQTSRI